MFLNHWAAGVHQHFNSFRGQELADAMFYAGDGPQAKEARTNREAKLLEPLWVGERVQQSGSIQTGDFIGGRESIGAKGLKAYIDDVDHVLRSSSENV